MATAAAVAISLLATIALAPGTAVADAEPVPARAVDSPSTHAQHRLDMAGLVRDGRCGDAHLIADVPGGARCTHGPDPAPEGITAGRRPTTDELYAAATSSTSSTSSTGAVPCYGDGSSGNRVQAVYAHAADVPDRYADLASLLVQWAGATDAVFSDSAAETSGLRHVRWVTDSSCNLVVQRVTLSTTGDDSMSNTINELRAQGLDRSDRKYLVWMDAAAFCGMSEFRGDDSAGSTNANNFGPSVARVDSFCWGQGAPVEAHELMHALGGVQASAPHSTGMAHCTDENDLMCYPDSSGLPMTYVCPSSHEQLFDCNHDDYFSTSPAAGSYLATHWNSASSGFLATTPPDGAATGTTPTTTSPPMTVSYSGSVSRRAPSTSYTLTSGSGPLTASVKFGKRAKLTLSIVEPDGSVLASSTGSSPVSVSATVSAGNHRMVVTTSGGNTSFTLDVTYPAP